MQDTFAISRKIRVHLSDYDYLSDIRSRILLSTLSQEEVTVLEEILFSPLQFSLEYLVKNVAIPLPKLLPILEKLSSLDLFSLQNGAIQVDKEKRKYFEVQVERFSAEFRPDMEFLQNILRNVPIHILPSWYHIPRSSNNIFNSLLEKYLLTPQIYQRHLFDALSESTLFAEIGKEVLQKGRIETEELLSTYGLSLAELEEIIIALEFQLIAYASFTPEGTGWKRLLTPLAEWSEYKHSLTEIPPISKELAATICPFRTQEFAFIEDMTSIIHLCEQEEMVPDSPEKIATRLSLEEMYVKRLLDKLHILGLTVVENGRLKPTYYAFNWIEIEIIKRAHITFKHPHNLLSIQKISPLATQRTLLEIEKSLALLPENHWIYLEDFFSHVKIALREEKKIVLKKNGRFWQYTLPEYDAEEKEFLHTTIMDWFFEAGIVRIGTLDDKSCFSLTSLGKSLTASCH